MNTRDRDLVSRLRQPVTANSDPGLTNAERWDAAAAIEDLELQLAEASHLAELWKDRCHAEREAHDATTSHYEKLLRERPGP
jgi:hypothetical protein